MKKKERKKKGEKEEERQEGAKGETVENPLGARPSSFPSASLIVPRTLPAPLYTNASSTLYPKFRIAAAAAAVAVAAVAASQA